MPRNPTPYLVSYADLPPVMGEYGAQGTDRFATMREAEACARDLVRDGKRAVNVIDEPAGAYVRVWPFCRVGIGDRTMPDGRPDPTYWCARHDLHSDGRCAEHTQGGAPRPADPEQLEITV